MINVTFAALNTDKTETVQLSDGSNFVRNCFITLPEDWISYKVTSIQAHSMFFYLSLFDQRFIHIAEDHSLCGAFNINEMQKIVFKAKNLINSKYKGVLVSKETLYNRLEEMEKLLIAAKNAGANTISWCLI